jgi:hypothetical protein
MFTLRRTNKRLYLRNHIREVEPPANERSVVKRVLQTGTVETLNSIVVWCETYTTYSIILYQKLLQWP